MRQLHLIVHKSMIEEEISSELTPKEKKPRLQNVLKRIEHIELTEESVRHVIFDRDNPDIPHGIHDVVNVCKGYSSIILYGISTQVCLPYVMDRLKEAGFEVSYDQQGIIK